MLVWLIAMFAIHQIVVLNASQLITGLELCAKDYAIFHSIIHKDNVLIALIQTALLVILLINALLVLQPTKSKATAHV